MLNKSTVKVPLSFFRFCKVSPDAQAVKQQAQSCMPRESKQLAKIYQANLSANLVQWPIASITFHPSLRSTVMRQLDQWFVVVIRKANKPRRTNRQQKRNTEPPRSLLRRCKVVPSAKRITEQRLQSCMPYMWSLKFRTHCFILHSNASTSPCTVTFERNNLRRRGCLLEPRCRAVFSACAKSRQACQYGSKFRKCSAFLVRKARRVNGV